MKRSQPFTFLACILLALATSCTHMELVGPRAKQLGETCAFADYSVTVPDEPRWWVLAADEESQSMFLAVPRAEVSRELLKDGKPMGMMAVTTSGLAHPDAYTMYEAMIDLLFVRVPRNVAEETDAKVINMYLRDDASLCAQKGLVEPGGTYEIGRTSAGARDFTFSRLKCDKPAGTEMIVACAMVHDGDNRSILVGRLWTSKQFKEDFGYLGALLGNVKPHAEN